MNKPVAYLCEFYADPGEPFLSFEPIRSGTNIPLYKEQVSKPTRDGWDNVTDDQLIEEVRRRGFPIRNATIHPKPQAYLDTGLGAFYWSREFPEGPPPGFAPVYIDYTAK